MVRNGAHDAEAVQSPPLATARSGHRRGRREGFRELEAWLLDKSTEVAVHIPSNVRRRCSGQSGGESGAKYIKKRGERARDYALNRKSAGQRSLSPAETCRKAKGFKEGGGGHSRSSAGGDRGSSCPGPSAQAVAGTEHSGHP